MIPGCGGSLSVGTGARRARPGAAGRGDRAGRPGLHPGRRRHRQDPGDHPPDRPPGAHRGDLSPGTCSRSPSPPGPPPRCGTGSPCSGAHGVQARTFHAAALRQVRYFAPRLLAGRAHARAAGQQGPAGHPRRRPGRPADRPDRRPRPGRRDRVGQVVAGRAGGLRGGRGQGAARAHRTSRPRSPRSSPRTSSSSARNGVIDFEDMLRAAVWGIEEHPDVAEQIRAQYRHFVVDEYQDVNPLQQRLLDAWLGGRDDLTVVGDASQTIYSFTGATSAYLVDFPRRHRNADSGPAGPRLPLHPAGGRPGQRGDPAGPGHRGAAAAGAGRAAPARPRAGAADLHRRAGRGGRGGRAAAAS